MTESTGRAGLNTTTPGPQGTDPAEETEPPEPLFPIVEAWVSGHFTPIYRRALGGEYRWCSRWWLHAEAITRLTALWHSWETARLQPGTGIAFWLRDHLDHQLPVLLGRSGPFAQCTETEHDELPEARLAEPPRGWWDDTTSTPAGQDGDQ
jgi:hypothetical protein